MVRRTKKKKVKKSRELMKYSPIYRITTFLENVFKSCKVSGDCFVAYGRDVVLKNTVVCDGSKISKPLLTNFITFVKIRAFLVEATVILRSIEINLRWARWYLWNLE